MNRLSNPWCRRAVPNPTLPSGHCRFASTHSGRDVSDKKRHRPRNQRQLQAKREPRLLNLPRVVIDLDAIDSPYVRPFVEADEQEQTQQWSQSSTRLSAVSARMKTFQGKFGHHYRRWRASTGPMNPHRISGRDILAVAFLGAPYVGRRQSGDAETPDSHFGRWESPSPMSEVLQTNGIPESILRDDIKSLRFMLAWQRQHPAPSLTEAGEVTPIPRNLGAFLRRQSFPQLRRSLVQLLSSPGGRNVVLNHGDEIASALGQSAAKSPKRRGVDDNVEMLCFLNNFSIGLESHGAKLPPSLREYGLRIASGLLSLPAILNYLRGGGPKDRPGNDHKLSPSALLTALQAILDHLETNHGGTVHSGDPNRFWLFNVLTGAGAAGPSFRSLISDSPALRGAYDTYIYLLGQLGAFRSLWHEWHRSTEFKAPGERDEVVFAKAVSRGLQALKSCPQVPELLAHATGYYPQDLRLDQELVALVDLPGPDNTERDDSPSLGLESLPPPPECTSLSRDFFAEPEIKRALAILKWN
ncbi:hypothetical protein VTK73DRAFT_3387 [Phialemonium thermophilum]|uniref:Uncharacterized protein n=1 Tax=Phialemonium thermophilum TaxID=223376 RepID=A0ABR3WZG7_9PEZI